MPFAPSELILNPDQSIYHLNLRPKDLADTIITVGDPDRVPQVSAHFDRIDIRKGKREFLTHTGWYKDKHLSVLSTGIGTDNIDIVLNELDALANIDFDSGTVREKRRRLSIIRLGTSGAVQPDLEPDRLVLSTHTLGLDGLRHFYAGEEAEGDPLAQAFMEQIAIPSGIARPYSAQADAGLLARFSSPLTTAGITVTLPGFYGPQDRQLRLTSRYQSLGKQLSAFRFDKLRITNLEMESAGIYMLSSLLNHRALSVNCILANRIAGTFSRRPRQAVENMITYALEKLIET